MRPDPEPDDGVALANPERSPIRTNSHGKDGEPGLEPLELEPRMFRIVAPQDKGRASATANVRRQSVET